MSIKLTNKTIREKIIDNDFDDIENWDVSNVTNMSKLFIGNYIFNRDISNWDVSNVTDIEGMFYECCNFNQDIGNWNVSNVINMKRTFEGCDKFNQNIGNWDVGNVITMKSIFQQPYGLSGSSHVSFGKTLVSPLEIPWLLSLQLFKYSLTATFDSYGLILIRKELFKLLTKTKMIIEQIPRL